MNDVTSRGIARKSGFRPDGGKHGADVRLRGGIFGVLGIAGQREESDHREYRKDGNDYDELGQSESGPAFR